MALTVPVEATMTTGIDSVEAGGQKWTADDYMDLEGEDRLELLEGELVMVPSPDIHHQRAVTELGRIVGSHVRAGDLGECFHAPFDVVLADDVVVQPDFTFVRAGRLGDLYDGHGLTGAPDLVVEVLSASTASRDRHRKRGLYADAGVPWLIFVEPRDRVVEAFRRDEDGNYVLEASGADDETLEFGLFPELRIDLGELWFDPPATGGDGTD